MSCLFASREDFEVVEQRVALELDPFQKIIRGDTRLVVLPHKVYQEGEDPSQEQPRKKAKRAPSYSHIFLNCSEQLSIKRITVNNQAAEYEIRKPFSQSSEQWDESAFDEKIDIIDEGELKIAVPASINVETPLETKENRLLCPLIVAISYEIVNPVCAITFICCESKSELESPHVFISAQEGSPSAWMPCRDSHWERYSIQLHVYVPKGFIVKATGKLVNEQFIDRMQTKKVFEFHQKRPILMKHVAFAAGDFTTVSDPSNEQIRYSYATQSPHCGPDELLHTTAEVATMLSLYKSHFGIPFPYHQFDIVFVDTLLPKPCLCFGSLMIVQSSLVHNEKIIDQTWTTRILLAEALGRSIAEYSLRPRAVCDYWIIEGLAGFLSYLYVRKAFGNNDFLNRSRKLMSDVVRLSKRPDTLPIHSELFRFPAELLSSHHFSQKCTLSMIVLHKKIGNDAFVGTFRSLLEESTLKQLSTRRFFKHAKHRSALLLDEFRDRYIFGIFCPSFQLRAVYNRKKNWCEMRFHQHKTNLLSGTITLHVFETDKQTYMHRKRIENAQHSIDIKCHMKVRKNRKRVIAGAVVEEEEESKKGLLPNGEEFDKSFILKNDTPVRWIHFDPKFEWICKFKVQQMLLWSVQCIVDSNHVITQVQGCQGIADIIHKHNVDDWWNITPSESIVSFIGDLDTPETGISKIMASIETLDECLRNKEFYYDVRIEAIKALLNIGNSSKSRDNMTPITTPFVLKYFREKYMDAEMMQPNDFSDFSEYFVERYIPVALCKVRTESNFSPPEVIRFVVEILDNLDNSQNYYDDVYFVSAILKALGDLRPSTTEERDLIWTQILRHLEYDQMISSYQNLVLTACLTAAASLKDFPPSPNIKGHPVQFETFLDTRFNPLVRVHAFACLAHLAQRSISVFDNILNYMESNLHDPLAWAFAGKWADVFLGNPIATEMVLESEKGFDKRFIALLSSQRASVDTDFRMHVLRLFTFIWRPAEPEDRPHSANYRRRAKARALAKSFKPSKAKK